MKLRNKKTGEIMDDAEYRNFSVNGGFGFRMNDKEWEYYSLATFNEEWEDAPTEPLIKDEKIRELVRAWAQINKLEEVEVRPPEEDCAIMSFTFSYGILGIDFFLGRSDISGGTYSIAELCGEEEE